MNKLTQFKETFYSIGYYPEPTNPLLAGYRKAFNSIQMPLFLDFATQMNRFDTPYKENLKSQITKEFYNGKN